VRERERERERERKREEERYTDCVQCAGENSEYY